MVQPETRRDREGKSDLAGTEKDSSELRGSTFGGTRAKAGDYELDHAFGRVTRGLLAPVPHWRMSDPPLKQKFSFTWRARYHTISKVALSFLKAPLTVCNHRATGVKRGFILN
jgi:hypothetical protein